MRRLTSMALVGLASVAFVSPVLVAGALAQSSGPITSLPWGAKQKPKPNPDNAREADNQRDVLAAPPPKPVQAAPEPLKAEPKR